jgi:hypothetical protein
MVKIIDYGRAYFKDESMDSLTIYNKICKSQECGGTKCCIDYGYETLIPERFIGNRNYITSYQSNISHDLRLLNSIKNYVVDEMDILEIVDMVVYGEGLTGEFKMFGTEENRKSGWKQNQILNVEDAFQVILSKINTPENIEKNTRLYNNLHSLGILNIYGENRPMHFQKN